MFKDGKVHINNSIPQFVKLKNYKLYLGTWHLVPSVSFHVTSFFLSIVEWEYMACNFFFVKKKRILYEIWMIQIDIVIWPKIWKYGCTTFFISMRAPFPFLSFTRSFSPSARRSEKKVLRSGLWHQQKVLIHYFQKMGQIKWHVNREVWSWVQKSGRRNQNPFTV